MLQHQKDAHSFYYIIYVLCSNMLNIGAVTANILLWRHKYTCNKMSRTQLKGKVELMLSAEFRAIRDA